MPLVVDKESHLDHGLSQAHIDFMLARFVQKNEFFIETVGLPKGLDPLQSGIYGPAAGDPSVTDAESILAIRQGRSWASRLIDKPARPTRLMTVVAGPGDVEGQNCVLYTSYGGPAAPKEPGDFSMGLFCKDHAPLWQALVNKTYQAGLDKISYRDIMAGQIDAGLHCVACQQGREELTMSLAFWRNHAISIHDCKIVENSTRVELREWRAKSSLFLSRRFPGERHVFTCDNCQDNLTCKFSYNSFNVGEQCLALRS